MNSSKALLAVAVAALFSRATADKEAVNRRGSFLGIFTITKFPNDPCRSTTANLNGTCYTASECTAKGGTQQGNCANSLGACCTFSVFCGGTTNEGSVNLRKPDPLPSNQNCVYKVCRRNNGICRVRFDFATLQTANPFEARTAAIANTDEVANMNNVGDCINETFSITGNGTPGSGSPIVCGTLTGQHMILDASEQCNQVSFLLMSGSTADWDIKVTQHACGETDATAGPPNCLQYFPGTGTMRSFGFPASGTAVETTTHISGQNYNICFAQVASMNCVCLTPMAFGLSVNPTIAMAIAKAGANTACLTDYVMIPGGKTPGVAGVAVTKACGRFFNSDNAIDSTTICTQTTPFKVTFITDAGEKITNIAANMLQVNENSEAPGGIIGFHFTVTRAICPLP